MGSKSKEERILELFLNYGTKQWHFEEILKMAKTSRSKAVKWLNKFISRGIIKRVKPKGKMPYYIADFDTPSYKNHKKIYLLNKLNDCGLLNHLMSLSKAKTVIIFGSFSRGDWYWDSDLDIFIYGDDEDFEKTKYEAKLKRDIQIFNAKDKGDLEKIGEDLIYNIIKGNLIKGDLDFIEVKIHA